jgi:hypothetical protein
MSDYQKDYYARNKEVLAEKRKAKYRNDPRYREEVKERVRENRRSRANLIQNQKPEKYKHSLKDVCKDIGLSLSTFHTMANNNFIPKPFVFRRKAYLTDNQVKLLTAFVNTLGVKQRKALSYPTDETKQALENLNNNWN